MSTAKGGAIDTLADSLILDSSKSILARTRSGGFKGLQQFWTPEPLAIFILSCLADTTARTGTAFDPTAGNGTLLAPFVSARCPMTFGVEIDNDHIPGDESSFKYQSIRGDIQQVAPLMRAVGISFEHVVANPPFGLTWEDKKWGKGSSTLITWRYAVEFLQEGGTGAFICGRDRWYREISPITNGEVFYILEIGKVWPNVDLPTVVAFFTQIDDRPDEGNPAKSRDGREREEGKKYPKPRVNMPGDLEDLTDALRDEILETRRKQDRHIWIRGYSSPTDTWAAIRQEYTRRTSERKDKQLFTITVRSNKVRVHLSEYDTIRLAKNADSERKFLESMHRQSVNYFALNRKDWLRIKSMLDRELITLDPEAIPAIDSALAEGERVATPLYPVPEVMRLGFIEDVDNLTCTKSGKKFKAGQKYSVSTKTIDIESQEQKPILRNDKWEQALIIRKQKALEITVGEEAFNEKEEDIHYILKHFAIPDPGDVMTKHPDEVKKWLTIIDEIERRHGFTLRQFQKDDTARILTKGGGLFSWEQGAGKTLGGLLFAEAVEQAAGKPTPALFIAPQDLIPQWQRESKRFFGQPLTEIRTIAEARMWARTLREKPAYHYRFICYFEALSRNGRVEEWLDDKRVRWAVESYRISRYMPEKKIRKSITTADICPICVSDEHWTDRRCSKCGYNRRKLFIKPLYSQLTTAFKTGTIVVDEATKIKSTDSLMSLAVRGLRAKYRLAMTGTPIKNYIGDAFWILWWALGNANARFPYDYQGGAEKFLADFGVVQEMYVGKDRNCRRKILPQVSNLSRLWRLLASSNIRRRMENLGETIQPCTYFPVKVPFGCGQMSMYKWWLNSDNFVNWFIETHPDSPLVEAGVGMVKAFAAALGQLAKLEFATTLPEAEPSRAFQGDGKTPKPINMTPKTLKVLQIARDHALNGEKVLILSDVQKTGAFLASKLNAAGVSALHIVDESGNTIGPKQRAGVVKRFVEDGCMVLCASIQALNLGHNLDVASVCILDGLPWDFATLDQGIKRIRRLTSKKPISVYPVLVEGSLDERKWKLLTEKGEAADLALDGHLHERNEKLLSQEELLKELQQKGIKPSGKEIDEREIERMWKKEYAPVTAIIDSPDQITTNIEITETAPCAEAFQPSLF